MEVERSLSLLKFMDDEGLVPSTEEEMKRRNAIDKLKEIVMEWAKRVSYQRRLPSSYTNAASATIITYVSYGLGVHSNESDIDALCVGPCFCTMEEDFFIVLRNIFASRHEVSDLHCVKYANVPLMRFKFDGLSVDLPYAKLNTVSVPENMNVQEQFLMENMDDTSWRSFSGVLVNRSILQLVPNIELYQSVLLCVKHWAKKRGIYGNVRNIIILQLFGFFGGAHLAVLSAVVCRKHPTAPLCALVSIFFQTFAFWPWPTPVSLEDDGVLPQNGSPIESYLMPIQLPYSPNNYCYPNITTSTFYRIRAEFLRGHALTKDILRPDFDWKILFEPFLYEKNYARFLKIRLSSSHQDELQDWVGWIKSQIHHLLVKLEDSYSSCDPNPTEYVDIDFPEPNVVFYWGMRAGRNHNINLDSMKEDFMMNISNRPEFTVGKIELSVVKASELPKTKTDNGSKSMKTCWRSVDGSQQKKALYSKHLPSYFVGYLATDNENTEYL